MVEIEFTHNGVLVRISEQRVRDAMDEVLRYEDITGYDPFDADEPDDYYPGSDLPLADDGDLPVEEEAPLFAD